MSTKSPELSGVNLVSRDMEATLAFYRALGLDIPESVIWRTGTGAHHVTVAMPNGVHLEFDSEALAAVYNQGFDPAHGGGRALIGFSLEGRAEVDALYQRLVDAGYRGLQAPWDAFWGGRAAVVEDPDGNPVGLQSPATDEYRAPPPRI
jgi:uncharacterized glyoxalase superfamily protein PhnB